MLTVSLALLGALCWGVADFVAGLNSRKLSAVVVLLVQQTVGVLVAGAIVVAIGDGLPDGRTALLSVAVGATGAIALGAFYRALAVGTMSVVAPISASGVTLPVIIGLATGDRLSSLQAVGLGLTVLGIILASREAHEGDRPPGARTSIGLALIAAVGLGLFFTLTDSAADGSVLWLLVLSRATAVVMLGAFLAAGGGAAGLQAMPRRTLLMLTSVGVLDLAATGLFALANREGALSIVAVVGSLYPITTVLLARVVLHERLRAMQTIGVAAAFLGVAAVVGGS